jgi:hypothetical protein
MNAEEFGRMLKSLADRWVQADYSAVISRFADGIKYVDPLRYRFSGREELLEFFNDESEPETCTFHQYVFDEKRQVGAAEYSYSGSQAYHGTVWITLLNDKIIEWREYQHTTDKSLNDFWKTNH